MKKILFLLVILFCYSAHAQAQEATIDTLYFVNGKIEAVHITGMSEHSVSYEYIGEGIPISIEKSRLTKVVTHSGREILFQTTSKQKTVYTAEDWQKVQVTKVESEVEGLIRYGNVTGKAKAGTAYTSLEKMQNRALVKMKMQAAFFGCDVVFLLDQTNTDARVGGAYATTASSTMSGTAYGVKRITTDGIVNGEYTLTKVYRLGPNDYELKEEDVVHYNQNLTIDVSKFTLAQNYEVYEFDSGIKHAETTMQLIKVSENELVFLVVDRTKQSKIKYYNLYFTLNS